jgi:hypothetical protein
MLKKFVCVFTVLFVSVFFVSCGEEDKNEGNDNPENDVEEVVDEEEIEDDVEEEVVLPEYPAVGMTTNKKGDIAHNLIFMDSLDKQISLNHFYKERKLIWLIFSTYDCPACNIEKYDIPKINTPKLVAKGFQTILVMNGLLRGPDPDKEPEKVAKLKETMIEQFGDPADHVYGYLNLAQQGTFRGFINMGYPVNILIDGRTMEILDHWEGWDTGSADSLSRFLDFYIDEM